MPGRSGARAFDGCHAVVTGTARGIGEAIAENLAEKGAEVLIADIDVAQCMETMWPRLDILVNNAAMLDATPLDQLTRDRFEAVQAVNQNGALWAPSL